ncbi:sorbosone dehydrogenase family protein [Myxosarcina sp. GI1]|uniref:PQQ-dependent sugar dehydrogenase n=1 Tax=Myxosarcina sp. GI1 TaxID=1541065 RepID=UPI00056406D7|nr:sorbosone dehydrogenase family protein [Myxosarcina sp. GI1]
MKRRQITTFVLLTSLTFLTSCKAFSSSPDLAQTTSNQLVSTKKITTEPLQPKPIKITPDELPEPYATNSASASPQVISIPDNPTLNVPEGFEINIFADNLDSPRWLSLTPNGNVLVAQSKANKITLLRDEDSDGFAENKQIFADTSNGLDLPFGMAFANNYFFLGNQNEVRRYVFDPNNEQITGKGEHIAKLPGGGYNQHWTRNIVVSPNGQKLYVSIGSRSNASTEPLPRASVQIMNLDGSQQETFAYGLRNPVGLDFHPVTKELYATVNERDKLGDNLVPDYFTKLEKEEFYGWPYAYLKPNLLDPRHLQGGKSTNPELAAKTQTPDVLFQSHSAALGLQFYDKETFPAEYHNGAFVAFRGSWNRQRGTGYKLVFIPFSKGQPQGYYQDFVTGFLTEPSVPTTWGRPVGLLVLPDGSLLFTEESNGRIYRVRYSG